MRYACATSRIASPAGHPRRRAANCAAVARFDSIRQSASVAKSCRNVLVECRISPKLVADARLRIEYDYGMFCRIPHDAECWSKVGIAGDKHKCICFILVCIFQQLRCHVDVCEFFRCPYATNISWTSKKPAGLAWTLRCLKSLNPDPVVAFKYLYSLCRKSVKISGLPFGSEVSVGLVDHARGEILDCVNSLFKKQKFLCKCVDIKPFVRGSTEQSVVEVASVDIDYRSFRFHIKTLEPGSLPAPHRIAVAQRVVSNPSRGSVTLYQIRDAA